MDKGKRPNKLIGGTNAIYMDLREIIREQALAFLPAKSLFRFTGVCRDWKLKISTPFFAHSQTNSFRAISGLFCQSPGGSLSFISLDPKSYGVPDPSLTFLREEVDIISSSNGLLCCQGRQEKAYYVCNPVTMHFKKIPKPSAKHGSDPAIVLVHEPSVYDFVADYKLVCAFPSADFDDAYEFEIYSSASGCWKISGEIFFGDRKFYPRSGVHVNGVVYWKMIRGGVIAFDLLKERSQVIDNYGMKGTLGVMFNKLCKTHITGRALIVNLLSNIFSNTMEMNKMARTWTEKSPIHLDKLEEFQHVELSVLFTVDNLVVIQAGRIIFSFNMKTRESAILCSTAGYGMVYVPYVNSLVYL